MKRKQKTLLFILISENILEKSRFSEIINLQKILMNGWSMLHEIPLFRDVHRVLIYPTPQVYKNWLNTHGHINSQSVHKFIAMFLNPVTQWSGKTKGRSATRCDYNLGVSKSSQVNPTVISYSSEDKFRITERDSNNEPLNPKFIYNVYDYKGTSQL